LSQESYGQIIGNRLLSSSQLAKALDVCFILHADHEMLVHYGHLHGLGANEGVLHMLEEIGHASKIPQFLEGC
jgi:citrate synthase